MWQSLRTVLPTRRGNYTQTCQNVDQVWGVLSQSSIIVSFLNNVGVCFLLSPWVPAKPDQKNLHVFDVHSFVFLMTNLSKPIIQFALVWLKCIIELAMDVR